jgi:nucleotide-binding universal stress UspA family protein
MSTGTIVVGVDGSRGSQQALRWAAEEARLRDARLCAVHAWRLPVTEGAPEPNLLGHPIFPEQPLEELTTSLTAAGARILEEALASIDVTGLAIERDVVEAAPAQALLAAAQAADLLVWGPAAGVASRAYCSAQSASSAPTIRPARSSSSRPRSAPDLR